MKKILFAFSAIALLITGCSKDSSEDYNENFDLKADAGLDQSNLGIYKGIFTTHNAEYRAKVTISVPSNSRTSEIKFPKAIMELSNGEVFILKAEENASLGNQTHLFFTSVDASFEFSVNADGSNPLVENVYFKELESDIVVLKETSLAPVTPLTGTFECGSCNGHPVLGTGTAQTFNFLFTPADEAGTIVTQMTLGSTIYSGIGLQETCVPDGTITNCNIESGDGITTDGFVINGNPVSWDGLHVFNNEVSGTNDCSTGYGTWRWMSNGYGLIEGTFKNDGSSTCAITLAAQDFDGSTPAWNGAPDVAFFNNGSDGYFGIVGVTESNPTGLPLVPGATSNITKPEITGSYIFVSDLDDEENGAPSVIITSENITTTGFTNVEITFDYQIENWDGADGFTYTPVIDGVDGASGSIGYTTGDFDDQGTITISIPDGTNTLGLKIEIEQNGNGDYGAFDNFKITGI